MKPKILLFLLTAALVAPFCSAAPIFSWETGTEGWTADTPNSVATSSIGATNGVQSLEVTQPMSNMWWNAATAFSLSGEQLQFVFSNATELKLDVFYPNPGYNSWYADPHVEIIIQGEKVGWTGLGGKAVVVDGAPQTLTFSLTAEQAAAMASSNWGQIVLRFDYGNGGSDSSNAVFYVDNLSSTVVSGAYIPWISSFTTLSGPTAEKDADPDSDGLTNLEEFALDGNPEVGAATGKVRSRVEAVGDDQALVITLPVRDGASFSGGAPGIATVAADGVGYEIGGSNDLINFDQNVSEVIPALTGEPDMPVLDAGWTYRTFRLDGAVGGAASRGAMGFFRVKVTETP